MVLGLLKCDAFRDGPDIPSDARAASFAKILSSGINELDLYIRPRMVSLSPLDGQVRYFQDCVVCILLTLILKFDFPIFFLKKLRNWSC
jgi:hypothetical protein